jgi:hypothetical protein
MAMDVQDKNSLKKRKTLELGTTLNLISASALILKNLKKAQLMRVESNKIRSVNGPINREPGFRSTWR